MPRFLGLDYGERRLGFAVSDAGGTISMPLVVVQVRSRDHAMAEIERLVRETGAETLVVGLPLNMDGTIGPKAVEVNTLVEKLAPRLPVPVETWDERLTTKSAERVLIEANTSRRRRKEVVDKLAAQIMLQSYLDAHAGPEIRPL